MPIQKSSAVVCAVVFTFGLGGCATVQDINQRVKQKIYGENIEVVEKDVGGSNVYSETTTQVSEEISITEDSMSGELQQTKIQIAQPAATGATQMAATQMSAGDGMLPPNAKPGECYARVFIPPQYQEQTEQVLSSPASERIEVIPAQYEMVDERILVQEASIETVTIPAEYEMRDENIVVAPAHEELVEVPAQYQTVTERILVRPAYSTWKKGRGPIERVDNATGEIMCLVEVPAEYKTVNKRVLATQATTRKISKPAQYKTVQKRVMVKPVETKTREIPARYETVRVRKMVTPPQERRVPIPAEYSTVTKRVAVSEGIVEWRSILCETNTTKDVVAKIQRALAERGYNPGKIDGQIGDDTMTAVESFQRDFRIAEGQLTMETLKMLGVVQNI